jgi:NAD(P)-dependent dehydrogenase (short-subunit alcohol dehydrogenase family)
MTDNETAGYRARRRARRDLAGKHVLITGASSGIGKETAKLLLQNGYIVYGAARRLEAMEDLRELGARTLRMDITDDASIRQTVAAVLGAESRIDVLVNNAGYGSTGALEDVPLAEARGQFEVNVFGLIRLSQLVIPHMRDRHSGRIINISSVGGKIATPLSGWYNATKFSVEALSDTLRLEVKPFGIDVVVIEPGGIQTEWSGIAAANALRNSGHTVYASVVDKLVAGFTKYDHKLSHPLVIARLILKAIRASHPRTRYTGGFGAKPALLAKKLISDKLFDRLIRSQFE